MWASTKGSHVHGNAGINLHGVSLRIPLCVIWMHIVFLWVVSNSLFLISKIVAGLETIYFSRSISSHADIWGCHRGVAEDSGLLACYSTLLGKKLLTLWKIIVPFSSWFSSSRRVLRLWRYTTIICNAMSYSCCTV